MACIRGLFVSALLHVLALAAEAAATGERRASEASLVHAHADSVHSLSQKAASGAHLRARSHSSHGLHANIFRAATASNARTRLRTAAQAAQAPLYVPKIGLANVTDPTPYPPPPPVLHPWKDMQPLDTAVGNFLISGFIAQPTVTPPPSQASLDLAFACPALLTWPSEVAVSAPDPCLKTADYAMDRGSWKTKDGVALITWETDCIDVQSAGYTAPSVSAVTTYKMPNGDLFGSSQEITGFGGKHIDIRDCGGASVFSVTEKIYKQTGKADGDSCKKFHSCDGVLYFQYFMKDASGKVIALTPYTTIFQDSFVVTDPAGGKIAEVSRMGWDPPIRPVCDENTQPRVWNVKYAGSPPGAWGSATAQWPIAAMMTMLAHRDDQRQPDGQVIWSSCEVMKTGGIAVLGAIFFCSCICIPMAIFLVCSASIMKFIKDCEDKLLPRRMGKPAHYNHPTS